MTPVAIIVFMLACLVLYVLIKRYKKDHPVIPPIPKKMEKIMKKSVDTPEGITAMAKKIAENKESSGNMPADNQRTMPADKQRTAKDKLIEAFEDIKDIRYGKIGASNHNGGNTINKWIKISSVKLNGPWDPRGFTLEVYPKNRNAGSSRQTLVCLVRNSANDVEDAFVSLNTHNQSIPNTSLIKDVRVVRISGSGTTNNVIEVWIQFGQDWADSTYAMYYLYNFNTNDFVATTPQAQVDKVPGGQTWGITETIEPQNGKTVVKGTKIKIGDKWTMSGVGDAHGNDDWLRLFGTDEKGYSGGFAAGRLWTPELYLAGKVFGTAYVKGGNIGADSAGHEFRHANESQGIGLGYNTIYATGYNADQDLGLKARGNGKVRIRDALCINNTCITEAELKQIRTMLSLGGVDPSIKSDTGRGGQYIGPNSIRLGRWVISDEGATPNSAGVLVFRDTISGGDQRFAMFPGRARNWF